MIIGYIRVSTIAQDLENQKTAILTYCHNRKFIVDDFIEVQSSSRQSKKKRKIHELLDTLKGKDVLIVTELSRLGRSVSEVLDIVNILVSKKVRLLCIKENIDIENNQSIQSKIMITMVSLFADLERDLISKRTKETLAIKKSMGVRLGRPPGPGKSKLTPYKEQIQEYLDKNMSMLSIAKLIEVSYTTIYNFIRKNNMLKGSEKAKLLAQKLKIEKVKLHLVIRNQHKGGRGVKPTVDNIKVLVLPHYDPSFRNIGHNKFVLRVRYKDKPSLDETIEKLLDEIRHYSDIKSCTSEDTSIQSMQRNEVFWE